VLADRLDRGHSHLAARRRRRGPTQVPPQSGTYLQYLLDWAGRPTRDIDGIVAGDIETFLTELDQALQQPWGPLTLRRDGPVEVIDTPERVIKPRRLQVLVQLKGVTWQKSQVEISADEGHATQEAGTVTPARLHRFGLPNQAEVLFTIALRNIDSVEWQTPPPLTMRTAQGPFPMGTTYTWEPTGDGRTLMTLRNRGMPTGFAAITASVITAAMQRANRKDLTRLRALLEDPRALSG
jgi:hypothetical protein